MIAEAVLWLLQVNLRGDDLRSRQPLGERYCGPMNWLMVYVCLVSTRFQPLRRGTIAAVSWVSDAGRTTPSTDTDDDGVDVRQFGGVGVCGGQFMQFQIPHSNDVITRYYSTANHLTANNWCLRYAGLMLRVTVYRQVSVLTTCVVWVWEQKSRRWTFGDFLLTQANDRTQLFIGGGAGVAHYAR